MNKHNSKKKLLGIAGVGLAALLLSSCTQNFCSDTDKAQMLYPYEQGVTVYVTKDEYDALKTNESTKALIEEEESMVIGNTTVAGKALENNDDIYKYVPATKSGTVYTYTAKKASSLLQGTILTSAAKSGYALPSIQFWAAIDDYALKAALVQGAYEKNIISSGYTSTADYSSAVASFESSLKIASSTGDKTEDKNKAEAIASEEGTFYINPYIESDTDGSEATSIDYDHSLFRRYGYLKFSGINSALFGYFDSWCTSLQQSTDAGLGIDGCPTSTFLTAYKSNIQSKVSSISTCIATRSGTYGHYGPSRDWEVNIEAKDWGYAWSKGFLEGLLVYPISWMVDTFAFGMDSSLTGWSQLLALVFVTVIVRLLLMAATFKSTLDQQKMQNLQPQLAKLQEKYPNSNTNQADKARLSQEQMALYRRNKINPLSQFLVLIIQFPVFICVWSGLQGSAALSSGQMLNLRLSDTIRETLFNVSGTWYANTSGWWTALVLFVLMAGVQIMAMMLPRIIAKMKTKNISKMGKNPAANDANKQGKIMMIVMLIFTIFMGFMLPAAMGIYWLIGGLMSMVQTLISQVVLSRKSKKRG